MRPESTYRLQFYKGFTFRDATAITPYLAALGITHAYASPYLKARRGSTHGYDVIDHCSLNPELGTREDYDAWMAALANHGMSHVLDIVPNHVGVATNDNAWWNDVLEKGRASKYADYFDITWEGSPRPEMRDKVLLPVLGGPYGEVLEKGELKVEEFGGKYWAAYYDRRFPLSPESSGAISSLSEINGRTGDSRSFDKLDQLLQAQHYRLAYWRDASEEINYRRFFDIKDLAALRQENPATFEETHRFVLGLVKAGKITGLRVDHPDGLYDPLQYLRRLREAAGDVQITVEKILAPDEPLPEEWPVDGTTGYDFLNRINGLFVDPRGEGPLTELYESWTGDSTPFEEIVYRKKLLIVDRSFANELTMLSHLLDRIAQSDRRTRDFTLRTLREALRQVVACFPVYRTYIADGKVRERDEKDIGAAIGLAIERNASIERRVFEFISDALLLRTPDKAIAQRFAAKFQQLTAPVTAKGIEDTAFYVYQRFVSLNEVGGDPAVFGVSPGTVHAYLKDRQEKWPFGLSPLSTHDTKRSEDVRARLNVLSEIPSEWPAVVERWREVNGALRTSPKSPDANEEYLIYQTVLGAWPMEGQIDESFVERIKAYALKAMREAKVNTSWTAPDSAHEEAVARFITAMLANEKFVESLSAFAQRVSRWGMMNSLSQTLLRLTAPGVPDTYQGSELWDLSLVDPDNRRPVDYAKRAKMLDELPESPDELLRAPRDGRIKLFVTARALHCRQEYFGLFSRGEYVPLGDGEHYFAFLRRHEERQALVVVPRFVSSMMGQGDSLIIPAESWGDRTIELPESLRVRNVFTGERMGLSRSLRLADILKDCPVGLFVSE